MNRRQFLTTPTLALPLVLPAAAPALTYHAYCEWPGQMRMRCVSVNDGQRVGMETAYGPDWMDPAKRNTVEMEWYDSREDRAWAKWMFPEAFGPMYSK